MAEGDDIQRATELAASEELAETPWPPSKGDAERVGEAVGAAAAGAACTAYGAAVVAPVCAAIGGAIVGALTGAIWDAAGSLLNNTGNFGSWDAPAIRRVWLVGKSLQLFDPWNLPEATAMLYSAVDPPQDARELKSTFDFYTERFFFVARQPTFLNVGTLNERANPAKQINTYPPPWAWKKLDAAEKAAIAYMSGAYAARELGLRVNPRLILELEREEPSAAPVVLGVGGGLGLLWILSRLV